MPAIFSNTVSDDEIIKTKFISKFDHKNESANPGYYSVLLKDYNITTELTAALKIRDYKSTHLIKMEMNLFNLI